MFAPSNFGPPHPPHKSFTEDRMIGLAVLLFCLFLCVVFVVGMDAAVITPYNATAAVTQTWQAQHPATPTPALRPSPTPPRPDDNSQEVYNQ